MGATFESTGRIVTRYGLVLVLLLIGAMQFTQGQRMELMRLIATSPPLAWSLEAFTPRQLAGCIGSLQLVAAVLIAMRPLSGLMSCIGSILAALICVGSLARFASDGVWITTPSGAPALSMVPGQLILRDIVILGAALWTAGEAALDSGR
ncbi:MAG: hypothetical protein ACYTGG_01075 [Planctomycetota bacterium]|jgi:uncharacterized membrane protein YkgB